MNSETAKQLMQTLDLAHSTIRLAQAGVPVKEVAPEVLDAISNAQLMLCESARPADTSFLYGIDSTYAVLADLLKRNSWEVDPEWFAHMQGRMRPILEKMAETTGDVRTGQSKQEESAKDALEAGVGMMVQEAASQFLVHWREQRHQYQPKNHKELDFPLIMESLNSLIGGIIASGNADNYLGYRVMWKAAEALEHVRHHTFYLDAAKDRNGIPSGPEGSLWSAHVPVIIGTSTDDDDATGRAFPNKSELARYEQRKIVERDVLLPQGLKAVYSRWGGFVICSVFGDGGAQGMGEVDTDRSSSESYLPIEESKFFALMRALGVYRLQDKAVDAIIARGVFCRELSPVIAPAPITEERYADLPLEFVKTERFGNDPKSYTANEDDQKARNERLELEAQYVHGADRTVEYARWGDRTMLCLLFDPSLNGGNGWATVGVAYTRTPDEFSYDIGMRWALDDALQKHGQGWAYMDHVPSTEVPASKKNEDKSVGFAPALSAFFHRANELGEKTCKVPLNLDLNYRINPESNFHYREGGTYYELRIERIEETVNYGNGVVGVCVVVSNAQWENETRTEGGRFPAPCPVPS